jgi:alkylation response protein AidB-like acyl-CoA dehydrogenase
VNSNNKSNQLTDFKTFLNRFRETLESVFGQQNNIHNSSIKRGMPEFITRDVMDCKPLSVFVPKAYNGRGANVNECLTLLETASYHSLSLGLILGINGALFLQPLSIYGQEPMKREAFKNFMENRSMGGLMITEPGHGSDALHMQTSYRKTNNGFHITGLKHWGGLTGSADYWLIAARRKVAEGDLARDIDLFVHRNADNGIVVEEYFNNLGLYMLPYGRNRINVEVDATSQLIPKTTGIKMLLDILHRSRFQFPGMGLGFIRRMMDEAVEHSEHRMVGGKPLIGYDQVRERISKLQSYFTTVSALCTYTAEKARMTVDLFRDDLQANTIKTIVTDYMQEAAQSLLQLVGAKGYRLDHIAGRAVVDSRPFQIFEGSNDILYQQISESVVKAMRATKMTNLYQYFKTNELSQKSADHLKNTLDFDLSALLSQRKMVELGKAISRVISMNFVINLGERGFNSQHIRNSIDSLTQEINMIIQNYSGKTDTAVIPIHSPESNWQNFVKT